MSEELIKKFLDAGVHFGHQTKKWNPRMKKFIHGEKNGIYVIDLQKTLKGLTRACEFMKSVAAAGGDILFIGTKVQAREIVRQEAERAGMSYVINRWLGGTLTNFETIRKSIKRYDKISTMRAEGNTGDMTKKEISMMGKEISRLERNLSGIIRIEKLPKALFVVDAQQEMIAIKEAKRLSIPVVAIADTNADPNVIDYPIPGNDDAIRSISLILRIVTDAVIEGRAQWKPRGETADKRPQAPVAVEAGSEGA